MGEVALVPVVPSEADGAQNHNPVCFLCSFNKTAWTLALCRECVRNWSSWMRALTVLSLEETGSQIAQVLMYELVRTRLS